MGPMVVVALPPDWNWILHHSLVVRIGVTAYTAAATHGAETHQSNGRSRKSILNAGFHCSLQLERRCLRGEAIPQTAPQTVLTSKRRGQVNFA